MTDEQAALAINLLGTTVSAGLSAYGSYTYAQNYANQTGYATEVDYSKAAAIALQGYGSAVQSYYKPAPTVSGTVTVRSSGGLLWLLVAYLVLKDS